MLSTVRIGTRALGQAKVRVRPRRAPGDRFVAADEKLST
jgi:hypothetical protein